MHQRFLILIMKTFDKKVTIKTSTTLALEKLFGHIRRFRKTATHRLHKHYRPQIHTSILQAHTFA